MHDLPDAFRDYYREKCRDLPTAPPSPVHDLLRTLDNAVSDQLYRDGPQSAVDSAFEAVLDHPNSTWTREVLSYRLRQLFYS